LISGIVRRDRPQFEGFCAAVSFRKRYSLPAADLPVTDAHPWCRNLASQQRRRACVAQKWPVATSSRVHFPAGEAFHKIIGLRPGPQQQITLLDLIVLENMNSKGSPIARPAIVADAQ